MCKEGGTLIAVRKANIFERPRMLQLAYIESANVWECCLCGSTLNLEFPIRTRVVIKDCRGKFVNQCSDRKMILEET